MKFVNVTQMGNFLNLIFEIWSNIVLKQRPFLKNTTEEVNLQRERPDHL